MTASANGVGRWRIASITIRRFRGVAGEHTFAFDGRSSVLHGNNGVGKSTVALALQWILYGRFPAGILQNNLFERFLAPVGQKAKGYSGEVVFTRGDETLTVHRDTGEFSIMHGQECFKNEEAEVKRDGLLGIDMDTFVRAVLLQQSRIRSLLLDEPKERNKAIDRLLGMDVIEHFVDIVKPKDFENAAKERRQQIDAERREHELKEKLLGEQLEQAQATARSLKFLNKDLNPTGLEARYRALSSDLVALGATYKVEVQHLPACKDASQVQAAKNAFASAARAIRMEADLKKRAVPLDVRIAMFTSLLTRWQAALKTRDDARQALGRLTATHGERAAIERESAGAALRVKEIREELKAVDRLRQLLDDAGEVVRGTDPKACPVCEQDLPPGLDLPSRLSERVSTLASAETTELKSKLQDAEGRIAELDQKLAGLGLAEKDLTSAQKALDPLVRDAVAALGGAGIAENKVQARLGEALAKDEKEKEELGTALKAMEDALDALALREGAIREGLVPVIRKREEIAAHEAELRNLSAHHAKSALAVDRLQSLATQFAAIRSALLETKQELATDLLEKAGPRARDLYRRLVSQPVFDTLDVQAQPKAGKVDYVFAVRNGDNTASARDARLVLSDGQLTATALALFFGLAESASHDLDLLFVDDPTQNLDLPSKEAMAGVVAEVAAKRQVIVATQDEDFVSFLKNDGFADESVVHHLTGWDGNPKVDSQVPK
jgi:DNA repair exonuclease SbcCD ATPase subunit